MNWKTKLSKFRKQLVSGELAEQQPQLALVLGWMMNFALGLVMSAVPLLDGCGPFGVALTAQAGGRLAGLMCAFGASLGYLAVFGMNRGISYVAAVALVYTASFVFQELKQYRSVFFMPLIAGGFTLLTCVMNALSGHTGLSAVFPMLLQTLLACGSCYFFHEALTFGERDTETAQIRHTIALAVLTGCVLMALAGAELAGVASLGRVLSLLTLMAVAYKGGALTGCAAGTALGLAMDISTYQPPFFTMAYALCGLIGGVFSKNGRLMFFISSLLTGAVCVICSTFNGLRAEMLYEELLAALIFASFPNRVLNLVGATVRPTHMADGEAGLRRYTARRVRRMGEAFQDLYDTVDHAVASEENEADISRIFDRAGNLVCGKCRNKNQCWNGAYLDTLSAFNDTVPHIQQRGLLLREDLPEHFAAACLHPDALVGAINGELRAQMYRRQFRAKMAENRSAAYSQYTDMAEVLTEVSEELQNSYGPDHLARRRMNRYLSGLGLEADVSVFRDRSGRLHMILECTKLKSLLKEPGYLDKLSDVVGVRLCHPAGADGEGEGRIMLMEAEPLSVSVGIASLKKKGETVSGDRGTYFKTEQGVLCIILSDGMGSGENAARESVAAVRILERFLRAGTDPAVAMKILNSMMLLKNDDNWGFATVDLMCVDLFTGEAAFYKYGAAPSYVRSGKTVRRIRSETLAAGLMPGDAAMPDVVRLRLKPGSVALIASDGVIPETNDAWLRTLLTNSTADDTKVLARDALQTALRQYGCGDDMTVLAMRVDHRE